MCIPTNHRRHQPVAVLPNTTQQNNVKTCPRPDKGGCGWGWLLRKMKNWGGDYTQSVAAPESVRRHGKCIMALGTGVCQSQCEKVLKPGRLWASKMVIQVADTRAPYTPVVMHT
jgi:hypothetical protein